MVYKELENHTFAYVILLVGEATLLGAFVVTPVFTTRLLIAILLGLFYPLWGYFTHLSSVITTRLMLEYLVIGLIAFAMLTAVAFNV